MSICYNCMFPAGHGELILASYGRATYVHMTSMVDTWT